ncbi:SdpA family antimicrobial peptide system protein [Streptomyces sp. NPDC052042]|uniref:SdpA family antimicrobial peptide system protein n=1 Tax=Streptomyces sp. NPDC052042 TaxID=3365683 RepID=UPI0037D5AA0C
MNRPTSGRRWSRLSVSPPRTREVPRTWAAAVTGIWAVILLYVVQTQLPNNVVELPGQNRVTSATRTVVPQGWAFFTKSPRETDLDPYGLVDGTWQSLRAGLHAEYGFNRESRAQGLEIGLLFQRAQDDRPFACKGRALTDCLDRASTVTHADNPTPSPTLCGRIALVNQRPVPYAWRDFYPGTHTPESAYVLEVRCR